MAPPIALSDAPGCCVLKWTCFTDATARIAARQPTTCGWDGSSAPFVPWSPDAWRPYRTIPCSAMPIRNRMRRRRNALAVNDRPSNPSLRSIPQQTLQAGFEKRDFVRGTFETDVPVGANEE